MLHLLPVQTAVGQQAVGEQAVGLYVIVTPRRGLAWNHRTAQVVCLLLYLGCAGRRSLFSLTRLKREFISCLLSILYRTAMKRV